MRRAIALAAVYEIAVPVEAILALSPDAPDLRRRSKPRPGWGFSKPVCTPATGEVRYLVSPLLRPLLDDMPERLNDQELQPGAGPAAPSSSTSGG